jgi:hypothetical protein
MRAACLLVFVIALIAAGCGEPSEPAKQAEALGSISSEGRLVAEGVVDDRTTEPFVHVHGQALAKNARSLEAVAASPRLRALAGRIADQLDDLAAHAADEELAERVASRLEREARVAGELAQ